MSELHDEQALSELRSMAATLSVDLNAYGMREFVNIYLAHDIGELRARVAELEEAIRRVRDGEPVKSRWAQTNESDLLALVDLLPDKSG